MLDCVVWARSLPTAAIVPTGAPSTSMTCEVGGGGGSNYVGQPWLNASDAVETWGPSHCVPVAVCDCAWQHGHCTHRVSITVDVDDDDAVGLRVQAFRRGDDVGRERGHGLSIVPVPHDLFFSDPGGAHNVHQRVPIQIYTAQGVSQWARR